MFLFTGDELYPSTIDYNDNNIDYIDKTILELREKSSVIHRVEIKKTKANNNNTQIVLKNYKPNSHIDMGDIILPVRFF